MAIDLRIQTVGVAAGSHKSILINHLDHTSVFSKLRAMSDDEASAIVVDDRRDSSKLGKTVLRAIIEYTTYNLRAIYRS